MIPMFCSSCIERNIVLTDSECQIRHTCSTFQRHCCLLLNKLFWIAAMGGNEFSRTADVVLSQVLAGKLLKYSDTAATSVFSIAACRLLKRKMLLYLTDYFFWHPKKQLTLYFSIGRRG